MTSTTTNLPTKSWDYSATSGQPDESDTNKINVAVFVEPQLTLLILCVVIRHL